MKLYILALVLIAALLSCKEKKQLIDCSKFKTGKFEFRAPDMIHKYLLERNDSIQFEEDLNLGRKMKFKVNWVEPCVYDLEFISVINGDSDNIISMFKNNKFPVVRTQIIEGSKNYYVSKSSVNGGSFGERDTILISK